MEKINKFVLTIVFLHISTLLIYGNDQTYVIGVGFGGADYQATAESESGEKEDLFSYKPTVGSNIHFEWYLFDSIGVGLRTLGIQTPEVASYGMGEKQSSYVPLLVNAQLVTFNWIFYGENDYSRLGLTLGYGSSSINQNFYDGTGCENKGSASLGGLFFDWGADGFGARLGVDGVTNNLDEYKCGSNNKKNISGAGSSSYLGLRWAF